MFSKTVCFFAIICICLAQVILSETKLNTTQIVQQSNSSATVIQPRIAGGQPISITQAPWQVSVRLKSVELLGWGRGHICGGAVISSRVVLTAAHCVASNNVHPTYFHTPDQFTLVMGSIYLYEPTQYTLQYDVLLMAIAPGFNVTSLVNDLALFFINGAIPKNYPTVWPIALNPISEPNNTMCSTSGWGASTTNGQFSNVLLGALIPVISNQVCSQYLTNITTGMLCAAESSTSGICQGDLGGPLVCNNYLAGITSWGDSCQVNFPGVFSNISYHSSWITWANTTFDYNYYPSNNGNKHGNGGNPVARLAVALSIAMGAVFLYL